MGNNGNSASICFEDMSWASYCLKMGIAICGLFSIAVFITSIYIVGVGYTLATFFYWSFTTNLYIPVDYHTWFIIASIPMVNVLVIVAACLAVAIKFTLIFVLVDVIPMVLNWINIWTTNVLQHIK